ncbi:MAG: hypothetical protein WCC08_20215, partial [Terrimicrobiaceae bacterium]
MRPNLRKGLLALAISFPVFALAEIPARAPKPAEAAAEHGKLSAEDLAKMTQNPVANLISVP